MYRIAGFDKVSYAQFEKDWLDKFGKMPSEGLENIYNNIKIPSRATRGSAGYDFYAPVGFTLKPGETITVPTGIRARIEEGWVLQVYPRSGLGFKYRLRLNNTVGIIDSDYYYSDNEGHIFIKITNEGKVLEYLRLERGTAFAQGIFIPFGITYEDCTEAIRNGGFGSTDKK